MVTSSMASLEHPLIVALRHAGASTQQAAQHLLVEGADPRSEPAFAALIEGLIFDQTGVEGRYDKRLLRTRGPEYRAKRREATARFVNRTQISHALISLALLDQRRIVAALAAGAGMALARQLQADWYELFTAPVTDRASANEHWAIRLSLPAERS